MSEQTKSPEEDLDELVHEACSEIASSINNSGEEAQREFLRDGIPLVGDRHDQSNHLMAAMCRLEQCYDQVAHVYRELSGLNKYPTNVSQDLAQLISMSHQQAKAKKFTPRVQTNSLRSIPGRGLVLDCTILDGSPAASFINESIRYNGKLYRITRAEVSSAAKHRVGFQVFEEAELPPRHEPVNYRFQSSAPEMQFLPSRPARDVFARGVLDKAWEEQKKRPWTIQHDYADLELRVFALALKQMGLGEWYHELIEMVCFPDVDDLNYIRDQIKEHLNDERVRFLQEPKAPGEGDEGVPEDRRDR